MGGAAAPRSRHGRACVRRVRVRVALGGSRAWNHNEFVGESEAFAPFRGTFGLIKTPAVELFVFIPRPSSSVHLLVLQSGLFV